MKNISTILADFNGSEGTSSQKINEAQDAFNLVLPKDYTTFLGITNGGEGMIGDTYLILWKAEELADMNQSYQVSEYAPGLLLFGSDGGGEAFAFDTRNANASWPVVKVPFVGMDLQYAEKIADSFNAFLNILAI
jgi:hypothetical protein